MKFIFQFLLAIILPFSSAGAALPKVAVEPVVILGGGVGSLTSALYLGRAGLSPLVIEGPTPGGLLTQSHMVQNWPGVMEIDGTELTEKMRAQAEASGARFAKEEVISIDFSHSPLKIETKALDGSGKKRKIEAQSCIIAMGTKPNFLNIPGEQEYWGRGVTNCAICDGSLYKGKVVGVVGGGDAAVLEALYLSNIAKEVHLFIRKDSLRAIEEKRVQVLKEKKNVVFHYNTIVKEVQGDGTGVTGALTLTGKKQGQVPLDGLFLAIGSTPNSALFKTALKLDKKGYVLLQKDQETSIKGVYAIGDIVDPVYKQAVSAAGDGAKAALQVQSYLSDRAHNIVASPVKEGEKGRDCEVIEVVSLEQFKAELASSDVPIVVDFYATWCGPCKRISPVLESSASALAGRVKFLKVNVDQLLDLSADYNIRSMPTVLLLDTKGKELSRKVGLDQIQELLNQLHSENRD